jgi:hypothetical protein
VVYDAIIDKDEETGEESIKSQSVKDEHVYWEDFRTSSGRKWSDVWWVGRCHYYSRDDLKKYFPDAASLIPLNAQLADTVADRKKDEDDTFKRARVWEIWDKSKRQRVYVAEDYNYILKKEDDPYKLEHFFPCGEPLYGIKTTSSLVPVPEFTLYQDQANELDTIATRLSVLIEALKRRGVYDAGLEGSDNQLSGLAFAKDNEFVPYKGFAALMEKGGLKSVFQTEDLAPLVTAIEGLYKRAADLIQHIYDITGISDIMRGSSEASETATAQSLKANYGSMRVQKRQKRVQRFIREITRIKTEILAEHFTREQLSEMTGIDMPLMADKQAAMQQLQAIQMQAQMAAQAQQAGQAGPGGQMGPGGPAPMMGHNGGPPMPPGAAPGMAGMAHAPPDPEMIQQLQEVIKLPTWEEVSAILRSDARRGYKIDVETDQTAQADENAEKSSRMELLSTVTQYMEQTVPMMMQVPQLKPLVKETTMFAIKAFKAGRPLEEAFEDAFAKIEAMPPPQAPPDPKMAELQLQKEQNAQELQFKQASAQQDAALQQQKFEHEKQLREAELSHQMQLQQYKVQADVDIAQQKQAADQHMKAADLAHQRDVAQQSFLQKEKEFEWTSLLKDSELTQQERASNRQHEFEREKFGQQHALERERSDRESATGDKQGKITQIAEELSQAIGPLRKIVDELAAQR